MQHERTLEQARHAAAVRSMFSGIAGRYDLLNHLLSLNIDKRWRRIVREKIADILADPKALVLDLACGTGDLSIELAGHAKAKVIGSDFCRPMLSIAAGKSRDQNLAIPFVEGDAMELGFSDNTFDAVTIAFGLRNLADFGHSLGEFHRVLKSGGKLVVLEFSSPVVPGFRQLFNFYFGRILPRIGGLVSGSRDAYEYLPNSVKKFPDQRGLVDLFNATGFADIEYKNLTGGIAAIHIGMKR